MAGPATERLAPTLGDSGLLETALRFQNIIQRAGAVGEFLDGHVEGVQHSDVQVVERHFAVLHFVEFAVLEAEVFTAAEKQRIVVVHVGAAVAAAVVDERVVEQAAVRLGSGGEFPDELGEQIALEFIVLGESAAFGIASDAGVGEAVVVIADSECPGDFIPRTAGHALQHVAGVAGGVGLEGEVN